jgi:hypothetical protein
MANIFEQPSVVAAVALETLYRQIVLPRLVYTDIINDMAPGTGGKVTIPKPAVLTARVFDRSAGSPITLDDVIEGGVDVNMDKNIYSAVPIPDEDATLNIRNFAQQVLLPQTQAVAQSLEDRVAALFASLPTGPTAAANEVQTVTVTALSGNVVLTVLGGNATFAFNASAATVQTAITGVAGVGAGNATVTGASGGPYTVTFVGSLATVNVPTMTATGATVATTTTGTPAGVGNADISVTPDALGRNVVQGLTKAWAALTKKNVPQMGRVFVGGADFIAALLDDPNITRVDEAGETDALREARVNRVRGFQVYEANSLPADTGYAFTREAVAFVTKAPANPRGASASALVTDSGMTLRWLSDYDASYLRDRSIVSVLAGGGIVDADRAVRVILVP